MKVLYLNPDGGIPVLGEKGASVHVRAFVTALAALGHEVALACSRLGAGNRPPPALLLEFGRDAPESSVRLMCAALGRDPDSALADRQMCRDIGRMALDATLAARVADDLAARHFPPALIYERHALFHASGAALARRLGVPRILEVNAPLIEEQARHRGLALREAAVAIERRSFLAADLIVAVSAAVRDYVLARGVPADRVMVAANGVEVARFTQGARARDTRRARLGLSGATVCGFIGSFKPWHGMGFLLDALEDLFAGADALHLLAVGDGPLLAGLRARAAAGRWGHRLHFTGSVPHDDIPAYLAAMDFTVAPYADQPDFYFSPLKIVESMAAGRAVVAPATGQIPELITHGESGWLYAPDDRAGCGAGISTLAGDLAMRRAMGRAAQTVAARGWDWTEVARRILAAVPAAARPARVA